MRIVDRATFLALPAGTVFMKFPAQPADGSYVDLGISDRLQVKWDTVAGADFVCQDMVPYFEGWKTGEDFCDALVAMLGGANSPPADYDCAGRDGLFDHDQLFLIWDRDAHKKLIDMLQTALDIQP